MKDHVSSVWKEIDNRLYQKFTFPDFSAAFAFMTQVALLAEAQQHHPLWKNSYDVVEIWLSTHDAGNKITKKDRQLAEAIDKVFLR